MVRNKDWQKLEDWIVERLKEIDPKCRTTIGSGNKSEKGDVKFSTNVGLHIEAKWRNLKNVFNIDWFEKNKKEIPYFVDKIPVLITENKDGKRFAILDADDFLDLYIEKYNMDKE